MAEPLSPLGPVHRPGLHGNFDREVGVMLTETRPGSIVEVASWPNRQSDLIAIIAQVTGLQLADGIGALASTRYGFAIAPHRFVLVDQAEGLAATVSAALTCEIGSVFDLSHGRTALRIAGTRAQWVLAKLFALDFSASAFPLGAGRATVHHDIMAQIQRTGQHQFDIYVFRSFARSFWRALCEAAEEVGYEVK